MVHQKPLEINTSTIRGRITFRDNLESAIFTKDNIVDPYLHFSLNPLIVSLHLSPSNSWGEIEKRNLSSVASCHF
jgi:hypothetical protein